MSAEVIAQPHKYMQMIRHEVDPSALPINEAREELEHLIETDKTSHSYTWGYFPEFVPKAEYPACAELADKFTKDIVNNDPSLEGVNTSLAFVRRATAEPVSDYGGMHIDVCAGVGHEWDSAIVPSAHILRLLYNLGDSPRRLDYSKKSRNQLVVEEGIEIPRHEYRIITELGGLAIDSVRIPPIEEDAVYSLRFISSIIPHSGITGKEGHFMAAYGAYVDKAQINKLFHEKDSNI